MLWLHVLPVIIIFSEIAGNNWRDLYCEFDLKNVFTVQICDYSNRKYEKFREKKSEIDDSSLYIARNSIILLKHVLFELKNRPENFSGRIFDIGYILNLRHYNEH